MFNNLLESRAPSNRNAVGQAVSVVMHTCAIAIAVVATESVVKAAPAPVDEHIDFVAPPPPPKPPAVRSPDVAPPPPIPFGHQILIAPIEIPDVLPPIDTSRPITNPIDYTGSGAAGGRSDGDSGASRPAVGEVSYLAYQVEKQAAQIAGTGIPDYPEVLRAAGIEGEVRVQFVVDTTGRAELSDLKFLQSAHPQFNEAVRKALTKMRFKPAETGSHKVRQIVQMPFAFTIKR